MTKEQFIDKYTSEIKLAVGTLDIELIACVYDKFNNSIDLLGGQLFNKPIFIRLIDFEDKTVVLNNTLFYCIGKPNLSSYKHKLLDKYTIPIEMLTSFIYDEEYFYKGFDNSLCETTKIAKEILDSSDLKGLKKYGRLLDDNFDDNMITHAIQEAGDGLKYLVRFREILKNMCKKFPNDNDLGAYIRNIYGNY